MRQFVLILLFLPLAASAGTIYKTVGPDGRPVYSDRPPPKSVATQAIETEDAPSSPLPDSVLRYRDELQKRMDKRLIEAAKPPAAVPALFVAEWCGYCRKAKAYLGEKGVAFREYDIDTPDGAQAFVAAGAGKGIPVLLWKGRVVRGFSSTAYDALFASRP